jgi:putative oxidoreductase
MTMTLSRFQPVLLSILRMVAAFVFLAHGTQKLFAYPSNGSTHRVAIVSLLGAAGIVETIGGSLMLLGLFARPAAFVLSGEMAVAYFTQHAPRGVWYWPILNGGDLAVLFSFLWLFFCAAGPGPISLDGLRRRAT